MKKATVISVSLIVLGFIFECLYLTIDSLFFDTKFWLLGLVCMVTGAIGFWLSAVVPAFDNKPGKKDPG